MASLLSIVNTSDYGSRAEQKVLVRSITEQLAEKRAEIDRLMQCISGENTDCLHCIRKSFCDRRKVPVNVRVVVV